MMKKLIFKSITFIFITVVLAACGNKELGTGFNLFTIENDRDLGKQVAAEIDANPAEYPVLDSSRNVKAYKFLYDMRNSILESGNVRHKDDFVWRLRIIHDDETKNAFCTPGGYIYVYTGLMKFLDAEDQLAGVLAHEIAHADFRHSTRQMTRMYGVQLLLSVIAGDREALAQVTSGLIGLRFSRDHETEADKGSVHYLCPTEYNAAGGAEFFKKIEEAGGAGVPEFLSTHPSPENRIESFYNEQAERACTGTFDYKTRYEEFLAILP